jgi:hypothetical protein
MLAQPFQGAVDVCIRALLAQQGMERFHRDAGGPGRADGGQHLALQRAEGEKTILPHIQGNVLLILAETVVLCSVQTLGHHHLSEWSNSGLVSPKAGQQAIVHLPGIRFIACQLLPQDSILSRHPDQV